VGPSLGDLHQRGDVTAADREFLGRAVAEARTGFEEGGIPIGAVLVIDGAVAGVGRNRRLQHGSVIRHGEMDALEEAGRLPASAYRRATLYTTLSPCPMCAGAIRLYEIPSVVVGENRTFMGDEALLRREGVEVVVVDEPECRRLLEEFVGRHPQMWAEDIGVDAAEPR
jgi:cytosine deaminase